MDINFDEFKNTKYYDEFKKNNSDYGSLKIEVFTAYGAVPIPDTLIKIVKRIGEYNVLFFSGLTDSSGMIDNIILPSPDRVGVNYYDVPKYTTYQITVSHEGYETIKDYTIGMFGDVKVIQFIKLSPKINLEDNYD